MQYQLENQDQVMPLVKRMFWLAWNACGGPTGMGVFQDRGKVGEDQVFENVSSSGDYACKLDSRPNQCYGDYVFGRMMKLSVDFSEKEKTVSVTDREPRSDYQAWCRRYSSYQILLETATQELKINGKWLETVA